MKTRMGWLILMAGFFGLTAAWAHEDKEMKPTSPEFRQLQQLSGRWEGMSTPMSPGEKPGPIVTEFHVTAAGSAVEENLMKGTPKEMVDMYTEEGGKLAMTHYCAMGNQPHMVMKSSNPHAINLEMAPTAGIDPNSSHMHSLSLEFPDPQHLTERWTNYTNGKPNETVVFNLTKVK